MSSGVYLHKKRVTVGYTAERKKRWQQENKESGKIATLKWIARNPEILKKNREKYKTDGRYNDGRYRALWRKHERMRRANQNNAAGSHTDEEWETLKIQHKFTCLFCEKKEPEVKLTEDHIIPLTRGGSDWIENIQPLCRPCNARKSNKIIIGY